MEENSITPQEGEFHHFQLVDPEGRIPVSISVLVHYNQSENTPSGTWQNPIEEDDVIDFHFALKQFDGNYISALSK